MRRRRYRVWHDEQGAPVAALPLSATSPNALGVPMPEPCNEADDSEQEHEATPAPQAGGAS